MPYFQWKRREIGSAELAERFRRFWHESFDRLERYLTTMKKEETRQNGTKRNDLRP
jgi:hypothetical protein